jgi:hypothetical protein
MILLPFLLLTCLGAALLAPLLAGHALLLARPAPGARLANWLGLTLGLELGVAFPVLAVVCAVVGPAEWPPYHAAYVFVVAGPWLGYTVVRAHARHLRGDPPNPDRAALACLGFALALALALLPWVLGAPMPLATSELADEQSSAGSPTTYLVVVGPVALALLVEAWWLARGRDAARPRLEVAAALAVVVVVFAATVIVPRLPWNPRRIATRERQSMRGEAQALDEARRQALARIVAGQAPPLSADRCPVTLANWDAAGRFAAPLKTWRDLEQAAAAWTSRHDVAPCPTKVGLDLGPRARHLDGPLHRRVLAMTEDEPARQAEPWLEHDVWVGAAEARRRVRARVGVDDWQVDGTLLIEGETPSFSAYGISNLGSVDATLWLWSYGGRRFVCAGKGHVGYAVLNEGFHDKQATIVRDALRMRALALAAADLRAVAPSAGLD